MGLARKNKTEKPFSLQDDEKEMTNMTILWKSYSRNNKDFVIVDSISRKKSNNLSSSQNISWSSNLSSGQSNSA